MPLQANFSFAQVNAAETDRTQQPKLLKRSLALLHVEIDEKKLATSATLRAEYEKRASNNTRGSNILKKHEVLWSHVGGPKPALLVNPDNAILDYARKCVQLLRQMAADEQHASDGLSAC